MTLSSPSSERHHDQEAPWGWGWLIEARSWLREEIHELSASSEDPRELTDAAELLTLIDRKLQLRGLD